MPAGDFPPARRRGKASPQATDLGEFGTPRVAEPARTFGWFGAVVRTNPDISPELELTEFMNQAAQIQVMVDGIDIDDPAAVAKALPEAVGAMDSMLGFLQKQIHAEDWPEFYRLAKANRQTLQDLMEVSMRLVEAVSGFPTRRPSGSSDGPTATAPKSKAASSSPATTTRALTLVRGRPDLQAAIIAAHESREGGLAATG